MGSVVLPIAITPVMRPFPASSASRMKWRSRTVMTREEKTPHHILDGCGRNVSRSPNNAHCRADDGPAWMMETQSLLRKADAAGEILVTRLGQGYITSGVGFGHYPAGRSVPGGNRTVKEWALKFDWVEEVRTRQRMLLRR